MPVDSGTVLFLCTGNYYRSRFAEYYFRHLAVQYQIPWKAISRGLRIPTDNEGSLSPHTLKECERLEISVEPLRRPLRLTIAELEQADLTIAVKATEHQPLMRTLFPEWETRIEYWEVHDLDIVPSATALPHLRRQVEALIARFRHEQG